MRSSRLFSHRKAFLMASLSDLQVDLDFSSKVSESPVGLTSKLIVDIMLALSGIILLAPLLVLCFALTWASSSGTVLFRHRRVGFNGKPFDCLKFRTMVADAPDRLRKLLETDPAAAAEWAQCQKLRHDPRVTPIGAILRKSSLDELPQLFNVLRGDMSIIGPRPERPEFVELFREDVIRYDDRHRVKAGITGWAQVHGLRGQTSLAERVEWDNYYIANWSLGLDLKILALTVLALFRN